MIALTNILENKKAQIISLNCGFNLLRRLNELGVYKGAKVIILKNDNHGPIILKIKTSRLALGRGQAQKIIVQEV